MLQAQFESAVYQGLGKSHGVINIDEEKVVIEYQTKDNLIGFLKSNVHRLIVTADRLADISLKKRWFSVTLTLMAQSISFFQDLPFAKGTELTFKLRRQVYPELLNLVQNIKSRILSHEIRRMENG